VPVYICRWQNGDFSAVSAPSRADAIHLLDEVGNAEVCDLFPAKNFMAHFHLKESEDVEEMIPVELEEFGEETYGVLSDRVYPVYANAVLKAQDDWPDNDEQVTAEHLDGALKTLNDALETERTRQWEAREPEISTGPDAAYFQKTGDIPKTIAERVVKEHRRRKIIEMPLVSDKVN